MAVLLTPAVRNAAADAVVDRADAGAAAGQLQIYTGTLPADPDTPTGTLLATFTLNDPAYGAAESGVAVLDVTPAITATGAAAGDAGWGRITDSDGTTVFAGTVTATGGGGDFTMSTVTVSVGLTITVTSGTVTMPAGG